ncbi:hypothetical protein SAE01_13200 [Segetibacter aerophilus]|uniref:Uncharacterized protein n=1 Tax=Segetibacter aerophilus TaxID=670293 RepID=A0A512BA26_9BACT|nr:hypothetical protein SAE01_13200 [Segetibacter aerophilus]
MSFLKSSAGANNLIQYVSNTNCARVISMLTDFCGINYSACEKILLKVGENVGEKGH